MKRAAFFVDGFNFYHPIAAMRMPHLKWMSYRDLAKALMPRGEDLAFVKIFTAYATHRPDSMVRHRIAVAAWEAEGCECVFGQFKRKLVYCNKCRVETPHREEKESDVNLALHLVNDARLGRMDVAYVLSSDSDIAPAFRMCQQEFPGIELVNVAPPGKKPIREVIGIVARSLTVSQSHVERCLMPEHVLGSDGKLRATRPTDYDPPV